jgi:hypothetical protein
VFLHLVAAEVASAQAFVAAEVAPGGYKKESSVLQRLPAYLEKLFELMPSALSVTKTQKKPLNNFA